MRPVRAHLLSVALSGVTAIGLSGVAAAAPPGAGLAGTAAHSAASVTRAPLRPVVVYRDLPLPGGGRALVYSDGLAEVFQGTPPRTEFRWVPLLNAAGGTSLTGGAAQLPEKGELIADLLRDVSAPYAAHEVVAIYKASVHAPPAFAVPAQRLRRDGLHFPGYTGTPALNAALAGLGVDRASRLFAGAPATQLTALHAAAQRAEGAPLPDFSRAFVLHITAASVPSAVARLRANAAVAYAAPDWTVTAAHTPPVPVSPSSGTGNKGDSPADGVPGNYALAASAQSLLNRPGVDAVPAYAAIAGRYHQLPGQGETITNVSVGTLDDSGAAANPNDPCNSFASAYGPTTEVIGGQRYLDWPSMPLIPTYTADATGGLDPTGETCGADDPSLTEAGLDFSMMAPLPHDLQRPGALGSGLTDLLGIAPGARYRLVVPATPGGAITDVDAAFLAAARQNPRPDVITASLGFGFDAYGFPARYLEDDPLTQAVIAAIVHYYHIVVCVAGGDGLRTATNAAVPPSGGSAATAAIRPGGHPTSLDDVGFSTVASADYDSGSIDVGATTLDDITAAPPQDPANAALRAQHAFPETRYDGFRLFASAYGSRVNLAAPGDNVLSFSHAFGKPANAVQVNNEGGTSASAPETAAAAAVVLQVARLTGDTHLPGNPLGVRAFLAQTGTLLPRVPQSDTDNAVGTQLDVGNAVTALLARHGYHDAPSVARVAVEQRQTLSALSGSITTATDPGALSLTGRLLHAWITIAPDWTGLPRAGVRYSLRSRTGSGSTLAATPWARLQPPEILAAAGQPLVSATSRTVSLEYTASAGGHTLAATAVTLTFGPSDGTAPSTLAPIVPAVTHGPVIPVRYDISGVSGLKDPVLAVSEPGRVDPASGLFFRPAYTAPVTSPGGVINVPVSALRGAGVYGIGVQSGPGGAGSTNYTAFAFTRVAPPVSSQPPPPTLSAGGSAPGHNLTIPYGASFVVGYDVRGVRGADSAVLEVSAPGPTSFNNDNPFNNPNGSVRDDDGSDFGSVAFLPLHGSHGTATVSGVAAGLDPAMNHTVRVLPTERGTVIGEASGVSSVSMSGVVPADGGSIANGFGVSATGSDGFLTSNQVTASGGELGSVETFDQRRNAITSAAESSGDVYGTPSGGCPGFVHGDVGVYEDSSATSDTFKVLNPVAAGTPSGTWTPPGLGPDAIVCPAADQAASDTAVVTGTGGASPAYEVTTSDVAKNTFGPAFSLAPALGAAADPFVGGFGQDTAAGQAVIAVSDFGDFSGPPVIVTADLTTGALRSLPAVTAGPAMGLAVDPVTGVAASPSLLTAGVGVYDLARRTGALVSLGGGPYEHPAADAAHSKIAVQEIAGPDFYGLTSNNNAMSSVITMNEDGTGISRIERFNFFNVFLLDFGSYVQLNPPSRSAYTLGPAGAQLTPFSY